MRATRKNDELLNSDPKIVAEWQIVARKASDRRVAVTAAISATVAANVDPRAIGAAVAAMAAAEVAIEVEGKALRKYVNLVYRRTGIKLDAKLDQPRRT